MKARLRRSIMAGTIVIGAMIGSPVLAQDQAVPPLVMQLNNGNWLPQNEAEALRDELFYQRAVHAYMTMLPALNTIGMRDGSESCCLGDQGAKPLHLDISAGLALSPGIVLPPDPATCGPLSCS